MTLRRRLRHASLAVVVIVSLAACGSSASDAPTDAELGDFCGFPSKADLTAEEAATELARIGTPAGISDAERSGFEVYVEALEKEGDTPNSEVVEVTIPQDDEADGNAFLDYRQKTCDAYFAENPPTDGASG